MAAIQMTDRNFSNLEFMEELTDEELLAINGGWSWDVIRSICAPVRGVRKIPSIRP
jgi:hypothetical protein